MNSFQLMTLDQGVYSIPATFICYYLFFTSITLRETESVCDIADGIIKTWIVVELSSGDIVGSETDQGDNNLNLFTV